MKKVLLATTALVATAGFAMADVSLEGSGEMGIAVGPDKSADDDYDGSKNNDGELHVYSGVTLDVTFSGTTDNGLEFGASMNAETSSSDYDPGDFEFDEEEDALGFGNVWISGGGLTLTVDDNGIDDLENDDNAHDVQIGYASGGLSFDLTSDVDGDHDGGTDDLTDDSRMSYSFGYSQDGISASLSGNDNDDLTLSAGYEAGAFSTGIELSDDGTTQVITLNASFSADAFTLSVEAADDDSWEVGASFSQDSLTVSASTDSGSYSEITGSMDMGGGASVEAGFNSDDAYYLGAALSF